MMPTSEPLPSSYRIDEFLAYARLSGFDFTPAQQATAEKVLIASEQDEIDASKLGARLASVLAGARQDEFIRLYRLWFVPAERNHDENAFGHSTATPSSRLGWRHVAGTLLIAACAAGIISMESRSRPPDVLTGGDVSVGQDFFKALPESAYVTSESQPWHIQKSGVSMSLLLPALIWLGLRLRRRALWLDRASAKPFGAAQRAVPIDAAALHGSQDIDFVAKALLRPKDGTSVELDIMATVESTANHGGLITPVWREQSVHPGYIFFIERKGEHDHLASMVEMLIGQLEKREVKCTIYRFAGDPRVVSGEHPGARPTRVTTIATFSPHATIFVAATPDAFFHGITGQPLAYAIGAFDEWDTRVFMNLNPGSLWPERQEDLVCAGFYVTSASLAGLAALMRVRPEAGSMPRLIRQTEGSGRACQSTH